MASDRSKTSDPARKSRLKARRKIIQTANVLRIRRHAGKPHMPTMWTMRHINQAVCVCRRNNALKPHVYTAAGFRP